MVNVFTSSRFLIRKKRIKEAASSVMAGSRMLENMIINIVFVGKRKMQAISREYKQENIALPVLSFSYLQDQTAIPIIKDNGTSKVAGEVLICYPQAVLLAAQRNRVVDKMIDELVVHGVKNIIRN